MKHAVVHMRDEISELWRWWVTQLLEMGIAALSRVLPGRMTQGIVRFGSTIEIWRLRGRLAQPCFSIGRELADQVPQALAEEPSLAGLRGRRVWVGLTEADVLRLELYVPHNAERELEGLVRLHLEREMPISMEHAVIDFRVADRSNVDKRSRIEILVVQQTRLEHLRRQLESWHLVPVRWGVMGSTPPLVGNLRPRSTAQARSHSTSSTNRWLVRVAASLASTLLLTVITQRLYERWVINREVARLEAASAPIRHAVSGLQSKIALADGISRRLSSADAADVLASLTERASPGTWAYEVTIELALGKAPQIRYVGFTNDANALAQALETSPEFAAVNIDNVVDGLANGERQRVQLRFERVSSGAGGA